VEIRVSYFEHTLIGPLLRSLGLGLINRLSRVVFDIDPAGQSREARRRAWAAFGRLGCGRVRRRCYWTDGRAERVLERGVHAACAWVQCMCMNELVRLGENNKEVEMRCREEGLKMRQRGWTD
jgi:hypothetical protein